jgi:biotin-dependent carboxylase-like uncharacterized protein
VALANGFAAVYPRATPGGWQLVGRTDRRLFDPAAAPYAVLVPGDRVRFRAVADVGTPTPVPSTVAGAGPGRASLRIDHPGLLTLVQDRPRRGVAHLGVPGAGPADPVAHHLANRLVGNHPEAAALEAVGAGLSVTVLEDRHLAVVGGAPTVTVDGHPVHPATVVPVSAGQRLRIEGRGSSLRATVALAGGLAVPPVLGAASADTLSGLGTPPLAPGDHLAGGPGGPLGGRLLSDPTLGGGRRALRVLAGPHAEWFGTDALDRLAATVFTVSAHSDRVGLRLVPGGDGAVRRRPGELASHGMVRGAVQIPPDGHPVILGPDHATVGGYPVLAVVITADLGMLGRCRPGDEVVMTPVDPSAAAASRRALRRHTDAAVAGHFPTRSAT